MVGGAHIYFFFSLFPSIIKFHVGERERDAKREREREKEREVIRLIAIEISLDVWLVEIQRGKKKKKKVLSLFKGLCHSLLGRFIPLVCPTLVRLFGNVHNVK